MRTLRLLPFVAALVAPLAAALALTSTARADDDYQRDWRERRRSYESPQNFAFELRFGPFRPQIDDGLASTPYKSTFGTDKRILFGVEVDWQALRIPMLGTLGIGGGWSYTHMSAPAKAQNPALLNGSEVTEETSLSIMPLYTVAVLRVDTLARETDVPLAFYGKIGPGLGFFSTGNSLETQAKGHTWGMHYALGAMFLLDALDTHAANQLDVDMGINNTYFFFEWLNSRLDGFGKEGDPSVMNLSTSTWVMGLTLEM